MAANELPSPDAGADAAQGGGGGGGGGGKAQSGGGGTESDGGGDGGEVAGGGGGEGSAGWSGEVLLSKFETWDFSFKMELLLCLPLFLNLLLIRCLNDSPFVVELLSLSSC